MTLSQVFNQVLVGFFLGLVISCSIVFNVEILLKARAIIPPRPWTQMQIVTVRRKNEVNDLSASGAAFPFQG